VPTAVWMKDNGFNPFSLGFANSYGHPPLFFQTLALAFFLFGTKLFVAHLLIIIFSFLAIFFTYLIGEYLYGKKVGIFAALFLLFDPLFFAQSGMVQISVPFTALTMVSVYFALRNKTAFYLFAASCLVLFKEPAIFTISIITLYKYLEKDKRWFLYLLPASLFFFWTFLNKALYGFLLYPGSVGAFGLLDFDSLYYSLSWVFIANLKSVLTIFIITSVILFRKVLKEKNVFLFTSLIAFYVLFFAFMTGAMPFPPRYLLLVFPLYFIMAARSVDIVFKKYSYAVVIIFLAIFTIFWGGVIESRNGIKTNMDYVDYVNVNMETNMEYVDYINVNIAAISYLENNHQNSKILISPESFNEMFTEPLYGYIKNPLKVTYDKNSEFDLIYYIPKPNMSKNMGNLTEFAYSIGFIQCEDRDPYKFAADSLHYLIHTKNTTLIKKFDYNGKVVELRKLDDSR